MKKAPHTYTMKNLLRLNFGRKAESKIRFTVTYKSINYIYWKYKQMLYQNFVTKLEEFYTFCFVSKRNLKGLNSPEYL
jgi:hypothetical protein